MRKELLFLTFILLCSNEIVFGKNGNNTRNVKGVNKNKNKINGKITTGRDKRSLRDVEIPFMTNIGHEIENEDKKDFAIEENEENDDNFFKKEPPFWGTRGRRDSSESMELIPVNDVGYHENSCKSCSKYLRDYQSHRSEDNMIPFWSNRGRRDSDEISEYNPFWGNRGRRQEDPPFWGNRGRRGKLKWRSHYTTNDSPFWSSRGRRDDIDPFWGNRGRRDEIDQFWGNRGRRDEPDPFWGNRGRRDEIEPFWGNRGRRQINEPFRSNRGRRETKTPFWGQYGKEKTYWSAEESNPFWGLKGRRKLALKENIINAMNNIEYDVEKLTRLRRADEKSFWSNCGRKSQLENLFKGPARISAAYSPIEGTKSIPSKLSFRPSEQNTIYDDRIYAEEPHYILIERSSRSSAEDDPFFISRGKKYINFKLPKNERDRRGAIEDLVKSVRNDPFYIARGKKDSEYIKIGNFTILKDEFVKSKELICSAIDLLFTKSNSQKVKRDTDESDRERRTILKKLAAQLQIDPYFVSRGKKNGDFNDDVVNEERLEEFVNHVADICD